MTRDLKTSLFALMRSYRDFKAMLGEKAMVNLKRLKSSSIGLFLTKISLILTIPRSTAIHA